MKKFSLGCLFAVILGSVIGVCPANAKPREVTFELSFSGRPEVHFENLGHDVVIYTTCDMENSQIHDLSSLSPKEQKKAAKSVTIKFTPDISDFFDETFRKYVRATGIEIGRDRSRDYCLKAKLREFKIYDNIGSAPCSVIIEWALYNSNNQIMVDGTAKGRYTFSVGGSIPDALDKAYSKALDNIDWQNIAWALNKDKEAENKRADQEAGKQVSGDGDTALEHTVIRWLIISTPAGADVSWRVVSSTPDVRNTNSTFVGTTPYESTESFDIRGLNYNNAGNVQIEVTCEKAGYVIQRKRFNLRQAVDQKEISAKFNLVKDNEEE